MLCSNKNPEHLLARRLFPNIRTLYSKLRKLYIFHLAYARRKTSAYTICIGSSRNSRIELESSSTLARILDRTMFPNKLYDSE